MLDLDDVEKIDLKVSWIWVCLLDDRYYVRVQYCPLVGTNGPVRIKSLSSSACPNVNLKLISCRIKKIRSFILMMERDARI